MHASTVVGYLLCVVNCTLVDSCHRIDFLCGIKDRRESE